MMEDSKRRKGSSEDQKALQGENKVGKKAVADRDGKGLLGRPIRDYRYFNSQTVDAWPSANANACLERAQQGAIHSTEDEVWGFS